MRTRLTYEVCSEAMDMFASAGDAVAVDVVDGKITALVGPTGIAHPIEPGRAEPAGAEGEWIVIAGGKRTPIKGSLTEALAFAAGEAHEHQSVEIVDVFGGPTLFVRA